MRLREVRWRGAHLALSESFLATACHAQVLVRLRAGRGRSAQRCRRPCRASQPRSTCQRRRTSVRRRSPRAHLEAWGGQVAGRRRLSVGAHRWCTCRRSVPAPRARQPTRCGRHEITRLPPSKEGHAKKKPSRAAQPRLIGIGTCGGAARSQRAQDLAERPKSARAVEEKLSGYARTGHVIRPKAHVILRTRGA